MAPPLPLSSPQQWLLERFSDDNKTLKLFSRTKEALKIFRTGFFSNVQDVVSDRSVTGGGETHGQAAGWSVFPCLCQEP